MQKHPSEVYDDWQKVEEAILILSDNAVNSRSDCMPNWAINLSLPEIRAQVDEIYQETQLHYTFALIATIEGIFNSQIKLYVDRRSKINTAKSLRKAFKSRITKKVYIKFEDILDRWKKADPRIKPIVAKLKQWLQYRHWLAHGRHWMVHYWTIPDPNAVYLLYQNLDLFISFNLPTR